MSKTNPYASPKKKTATEPKPAEETVSPIEVKSLSATVEAKSEEVPVGTVDEILNWVGDDKDRAKAALKAEKSGKKRKSLIEELNDIIG